MSIFRALCLTDTDTFLAFAKQKFPFFSHGSGNAQMPGRKTADVKHETGIGYA